MGRTFLFIEWLTQLSWHIFRRPETSAQIPANPANILLSHLKGRSPLQVTQ